MAYDHILPSLFILQPDRGAKRPREEDGGSAGGEEDSRGGKQQKGLSARELARYREAAGMEGGVEMRETEELTGDKRKILDKLMDQDEEEPEVGKFSVNDNLVIWKFLCEVSSLYKNDCELLFENF